MAETPKTEFQGQQTETDSSLAIYLAATPTVETNHPDIVSFAAKYAFGASDPVEAAGNRHMEYIHCRGEFADTPIESMFTTFRELYPGLWRAEGQDTGAGADFEQDVEAETKV